MSNVISSFLVGIGFSYDRESARQIESGIDSIKSKALQLGSVVAGAFGLRELTSGFANSADKLGKFSQVYSVVANDVQAFGNALATEGGSLEGFMSQLESIERARARIRVGDVGFFAPAGKAGIDPNAIANASSATEAYLGLADAFSRMNGQERINAAEALGLDEASIRLLSKGRSEVEATVGKYKGIRPLDGTMTSEAAEFNRQWVEAKANVGGFADAISKELLPVINDITRSVNSWFNDERLSKLETIAGLTRAALGGGTAEQNAQATGLPAWMFTTDLNETGKALGVPDWLTSPISDLFPSGGGVDTVVPSGTMIPYNPTMIPQSSDSTTPTPTSSTSGSTTQNINVSLNLDGQVIDRRVVRVVDGMAQTAMDDIASSTRG